jgi:hypothetical protein
MKKLLLLFFALTLITSCQDDDTPSTLPNDYESGIFINELSFWPSSATASQSYVTTWAYTDSANLTHRSFVIKRNNTRSILTEYLNFTVLHSGHNANGTYTVYAETSTCKEFPLTGLYAIGDEHAAFGNGSTLTLTDMGNSKYNIVLNRIITTALSDTPNTITGHFTGTFTAN